MWSAYRDVLRKLFLNPAALPGRWEKEDPMGHPLTVMILTGWLLGAVGTVVIFLLQFFPILQYITRGTANFSWFWVAPVAAVFTLVFFGIACLMLGAAAVAGSFLCGGLLGILFSKLLQVASPVDRQILWNALWDSTGISLIWVFPIVLLLLVKWHLVPFSLWGGLCFLTLAAAVLLSLRIWSISFGSVRETAQPLLPPFAVLGIPVLVEGIPLAILLWKFGPRFIPWVT